MGTQTFLSQMPTLAIAFGMLCIILILFIIGVRVRKNFISKELDEKSFGAAEGALLGLLALLLSFTFSMSSSRHDNRIKIIVDEASNIGTAVLRPICILIVFGNLFAMILKPT